jgi:two-component system, NtrC family, sensor histidine kinase HydH
VSFAAGLVVGVLLGAGAAALFAWSRLGRVRRAERRARDAERLAVLGGLAGGLAHEIKNPLSTLNINLQLLEEDLQRAGESGSGKHMMRLATLRREVRRLEEVLEDFLRYARPHALDLKPVDLGALLDEMLDFVTPEATQSGVRISRAFAPGLGTVRVDSSRLKQAFLNIVINAKQAMPKGGELMVRTRGASRPAGIEIDFIDTGVGIAPGDLARIWDVYYSTKEKGTGLGLPTARRIVEEHGGTIRVHSEVGKGTCFTLFLPVGE